MKYYECECTTIMVGTDLNFAICVKDDVPMEQLEEYCEETARNNAESYGVFEEEEQSLEESGIEFIEGECYSFSLKEITKEEYDNYDSNYKTDFENPACF